MERNFKIALVVVLGIAIIAIIAINSFQSTGKVASTFTSGANYGPVNNNFNVYTQCTYLDENDGWDVTKKTNVRFYDRTSGQYIEYGDVCSGQESVSENHCEEGYRKVRLVNCPSETSCVDGACVPS